MSSSSSFSTDIISPLSPSPPLLLLLLLLSTPDQREKERETRLQELRQQRDERAQKGRPGVGSGEVVMKKVEKSADGSSLSQVTKTDRFAQSGTFCNPELSVNLS